ncbi:MAG TPA: hypothetical protein VIL03_06685 [Clostridia bacterium]
MLRFLRLIWPSLLIGVAYSLIDAVIRKKLKKDKFNRARLIFIICSLLLSLAGVIVFNIFYNNIVIGFGVILGSSLVELIKILKSAKYEISNDDSNENEPKSI